jgi:hypothetical protein
MANEAKKAQGGDENVDILLTIVYRRRDVCQDEAQE